MKESTRVVLALGTTQTLAFASTYYLPGVLAVPMARDLGLAVPWVFAAFTLALLIAAALGPAAGRRVDERGGRGLLMVSNLVFAAGLAILAVAQGPVTLALGWIVIGLGLPIGLYETAFAALAALYGREARGPITGITLLAGFASTVGWPLSAWLDAEIGWRGACLVWAALQLTLGLGLNATIPKGRREPPAAPAAAAQDELPRSGTRLMLLLGFVFAVAWFNSTAMAAHLPRLLELGGASATAAIAASALVGPAQVAARLLEFGFLRRFHPLLSARLATLTHPLGAALLIGWGGPMASVFTILHGGGNGILTIAKGTLPLALFGPAGYGLRQGLLSAPSRVAQAAAPLIFGVLIERLGADALWVSTALALAAFAALLAIRPTR